MWKCPGLPRCRNKLFYHDKKIITDRISDLTDRDKPQLIMEYVALKRTELKFIFTGGIHPSESQL